jgi:hypothetical protein
MSLTLSGGEPPRWNAALPAAITLPSSPPAPSPPPLRPTGASGAVAVAAAALVGTSSLQVMSGSCTNASNRAMRESLLLLARSTRMTPSLVVRKVPSMRLTCVCVYAMYVSTRACPYVNFGCVCLCATKQHAHAIGHGHHKYFTLSSNAQIDIR